MYLNIHNGYLQLLIVYFYVSIHYNNMNITIILLLKGNDLNN